MPQQISLFSPNAVSSRRLAARYLPFAIRPPFRQELDGGAEAAARAVVRFLGRPPSSLRAMRLASGEVSFCRPTGQGYDECLVILEGIDLHAAQLALESREVAA